MYRFAYLVGDGILAVFWLTFFLLRKDLRKQQLFVSCLLAPFAPLTDYLWFYHDYWRPEYVLSLKIGQVPLGIESPLFAFLFGGVATIFYEVVFQKKHSFGKPRTTSAVTLIFLSLFIAAILKTKGLNSIWAVSIAVFPATITGFTVDRKLFKEAIFSGILTTFLAVFFYVVWLTIYPKAIQKFWIKEALSGVRLWKIPLEELVWFFTGGMGVGILYEFWFGANRKGRRWGKSYASSHEHWLQFFNKKMMLPMTPIKKPIGQRKTAIMKKMT